MSVPARVRFALNHGAGGLGSIGAEIASMSSALKMRVLGIREHPERGAEGAHEVLGVRFP